MRYVSLILFLFLFSCKIIDRKEVLSVPKTDTVHKVDYRLYLGTIIPDTILEQLRSYKVENHLLRVEIDDLKSKLEKVKQLQKIDSILRKNDSI